MLQVTRVDSLSKPGKINTTTAFSGIVDIISAFIFPLIVMAPTVSVVYPATRPISWGFLSRAVDNLIRGDFAGFLNSNSEIVDYSEKAMVILIVPYILLALNMVTDSIFYGVGKTQYQAYQAIITNGTVYVIAFISYLTNIWTPTFTSILILFGVGIVVDSILTVYYAFRVLFPKVIK